MGTSGAVGRCAGHMMLSLTFATNDLYILYPIDRKL